MNNTRRYRLSVLYLIIQLFIFSCSVIAEPASRNDPGTILDLVEKGITTGDVGLFTEFLGSQVAITMSGDRSGRYSQNQAFSILKNFFILRKTLTFAFTTKHVSERSAYATGGGKFIHRGTKENLQIYVVLDRVDERWIITQILFY